MIFIANTNFRIIIVYFIFFDISHPLNPTPNHCIHSTLSPSIAPPSPIHPNSFYLPSQHCPAALDPTPTHSFLCDLNPSQIILFLQFQATVFHHVPSPPMPCFIKALICDHIQSRDHPSCYMKLHEKVKGSHPPPNM